MELVKHMLSLDQNRTQKSWSLGSLASASGVSVVWFRREGIEKQEMASVAVELYEAKFINFNKIKGLSFTCQQFSVTCNLPVNLLDET